MFSKIKGALWESSDSPAAPSTPTAGQPAVVGQPTVQTAGSPVATGLDPEMLADINKTVLARPTAFTSLEEKAATLKVVIEDESLRIKAAFQIIRSEGKSAEAVLTSIDLHVRDVTSQKNQMAASGKEVASRRAGALRQEVASLEQQNSASKETIAQLEQQANMLRQQILDRTLQISSKTQEADNAEREIQLKIDRFNMAADHVITNLSNKKMTLSSMLA